MNSSNRERMLSAQRFAKAGQYRQALEALKDVKHPKADEWRATLQRRMADEQPVRRRVSLAAVLIFMAAAVLALVVLVIVGQNGSRGAVQNAVPAGVTVTPAAEGQVQYIVVVTPTPNRLNPNDVGMSYDDYCRGYADTNPLGSVPGEAYYESEYNHCMRLLVEWHGPEPIATP